MPSLFANLSSQNGFPNLMVDFGSEIAKDF